MRHTRPLRLASLLLVALAVAALPGTTSALIASVPQSEAVRQATSDPIVLAVRLDSLLVTAEPREPRTPQVDDPTPDVSEIPVPDVAAISQSASIFDFAQVVSIYGHPDVCFMGELGCNDLAGAIKHVRDLAAQYDAHNGDRLVIPALHLIVDVAQPRPQADGSYLLRMGLERIGLYVEATREHDMLLFLDLQIGWEEPLTSVTRIEPALLEPFVHVALDPEFATKARNSPPGKVIGSVTAAQINAVQHYLAALVREHNLPPKLLVVHQFLVEMIRNPQDIEVLPEVEVVIDMDGYGPPAPKLGGYGRYALAGYAQRAGFKLFYHWDKPLMTPKDVQSLERPPDYIIYQ